MPKKVYITRKKLNEEVTITDPTLAQQYLAVKKQIVDKTTKRDQLLRNANQIDSEINILNKNLIALETKAVQQGGEKTVKSENQAQQNQAQNQTQPQQEVAESVEPMEENFNTLPKKYTDIDDYREEVISFIDKTFNDGESLVYLFDDILDIGFETQAPPSEVAKTIIGMELNVRNKMQSKTNESLNESVYDDMISNIEKEFKKLSDIKDYIENYDREEEYETASTSDELIDIQPKDVDNDDNTEEYIIPPIPIGDEDDIEVTSPFTDDDNLVPDEEEVNLRKYDPFFPSTDERIVDETLKAEDKPPYVPDLVEAEDVETELELLNYEDEDQLVDEYLFHVRLNGESDREIIAKFYRDDEDDDWTVRVVKGDEEPLQSMQFDRRLDNLDIIGYLADMYDEVEIIDPKEYEYLLDDKEKVDAEYYGNLN